VQVVDLVLQTSDVIVVCFDATRQPTLDSIRTLWWVAVLHVCTYLVCT